MTFNPQNTLGPFLQTSVFFPENFDEFRVKFLELYRDISNTVNTRETGIFDLVEFLTGENWFTIGNPQVKRKTFRKCFSIGAIAAGATLTTAHGITQFSPLTFTHIYGTVITDAATFNKRPIPYASATLITDQIQLDADDTNFRIVNGATAPNITSGIVVLEYLKN